MPNKARRSIFSAGHSGRKKQLENTMNKEDSILVTGGAGFIGSNFVLSWIKEVGSPVINLDSLTYAGNRNNLQSLGHDSRHIFVHGDMADAPATVKGAP